MEITYKAVAEFESTTSEGHGSGLSREEEIAQVDEWIVAGASACPREKTLRQRSTYFSNLKFHTISELLQEAGK
jgi:hypothetical protein